MPAHHGSTSGAPVCTVLPTYNERHNMPPLIERLLACMPPPYLILVVDDDSPDGTWQVVEELAARANAAPPAQTLPGQPLPSPSETPPGQPFSSLFEGEAGRGSVALVRRTDARGLTSAIQRGIHEAIHTYGAGVVTWMDCDLSMPPEAVPRLVQAIVGGHADIAVGSRWIAGGADVAHGLMARVLSWIINRLAILMLGNQVHDYTSGFIAARAGLLEQIPLRGDYGEYCIDLLARAGRMGYRLVEVPYVCVPRKAGDSKTGVNLWDYLSKGRKYVATIWNLRQEQRHHAIR